jgi:hypothetical protein
MFQRVNMWCRVNVIKAGGTCVLFPRCATPSHLSPGYSAEASLSLAALNVTNLLSRS